MGEQFPIPAGDQSKSRIPKPTWMRNWILLTVGLVSLLMLVPIVNGQGSALATVTGYTIQCDNFRVLYTVSDPLNGYYEARLTVYTAQGTAVGNTIGPGQTGYSYTVDVPISPAQPEQTSLYVVIELHNGSIFISSTQTTPDPCYGGGTGHNPIQTPSSPSNPSSGGWNGWSDGRLNPHQAEYYTIYCAHSSIKVYGRSNDPNNLNPVLMERIPLEMVESLSPNGGQMLWNTGFLVPYVLTRSGDIITIEGNFGYLMPQPGSKSFSLTQCQERDAATEADPGYFMPKEMFICIDYEGTGYTSPRCIAAAAQRTSGNNSRALP